MRNGFILLHRKGIEADEWKHPLRTLAWIDLCTMAAWDEHTAKDGVPMKRGEVIICISSLARRWRRSKSVICKWLSHWIGERMIERLGERVREREGERFSIVNYAKYQDLENEEENGRENPEENGRENLKEQYSQKQEKKNKTYVCRPETESLYETIDGLCHKYQVENRINKKALDLIVDRYVGKIHMKVEAQHCIAWLIGKELRMVSDQRIGNWFKKAQEIQKRDQLKQLERKEAEINPAMAQRRKELKTQQDGFSQEQSISDFTSSQSK